MSKLDLKIAGLTLAQQSRLYKRLARSKRYHPDTRRGFEHKRVHEIRSEARSNHLALGFLRGLSIQDMELPLRAKECGHIHSVGMTRTAPNWERIEEIVMEHGGNYFENEQQLRQRFAEFKDDHQEYAISTDTVWN